MQGPIPQRAAPYEEFSFSWGSRHHCPMEVGAYGGESDERPKLRS